MELALNGVDSIRKKMINRRNIWNLPESNLIENQYQIYNKQLSYYSLLLYISIFIFSLGIVLWSKYDSIDRRIILRQNFDKPLVYERCQSCAKIFDSEVKYGTKSDQSLNFVYCFECYQKGKFTEPKLTMQEQLTLIVPPIDKKYNPLYRIYFGLINYIKLVYFQIKLGELDRWKTNRYFKNFKADIFLFLALLNIILLITIILFKIIF